MRAAWCPADVLVAGAAVALLAADVQLYRRGDRLITDTLRTKPATFALLILTGHVIDVLGPFDPFRAAARLIPRSAPCLMPSASSSA
jgi:hypothetical protein